MKKLIISVFVLLLSMPVISLGDEIKIWIQHNPPTTRSVQTIPEASIDKDLLSVSFDGSGVYSLYVEDSYGVTVYQSMLPANSMEYDYDLSGIGEGLFRLILSNGDDEYEGYFTLR
ncbi:MAG TPA: DUF3244 domain-containing protein [Candidatus Coprenecus stercoravium]|uniref:DUF3244 domain-containing protein n=1 Tax=Candidatus Coprenecus stercoravium TaxID=2840735 RepID=A0A9D2KAZ7_9BACT|nr:DUF3244 domain-containing protein [Candidatus Coprenecus stercoravium]